MLANDYKPSQSEVEKYLSRWDSLENYVLQENALDKLFFNTYPENDDIDEILIKVSALNDFYSTNIFNVFPVAKHILSLNIDEAIKNADESIVNKVALVNMNGKMINFYSFATKYCSHHFPNDYPIYDTYVEKVLVALNKRDRFSKFRKVDLKNFSFFKSVVIDFRSFYDLNDYSLKDIDRYIWQLGKECFPNNY